MNLSPSPKSEDFVSSLMDIAIAYVKADNLNVTNIVATHLYETDEIEVRYLDWKEAPCTSVFPGYWLAKALHFKFDSF